VLSALFRVSTAPIVILSAIACGDSTNLPIPVGSIDISPDTAWLIPGQVEELEATVIDRRGEIITDQRVTWSSLDPAIANVDATGLVYAVAPGSARVRGSVGGVWNDALIQVTIPFSSIAAGFAHTCGLGDDGVAHCWGQNSDGQLGDASRENRNVPTPVATDSRFGSLSPGGAHTCAVATVGEAYCWGRGDDGALGSGTTVSTRRPEPVHTTTPFATITAGNNHTCAVTKSGSPQCWGANSYGQLGNGTTDAALEPVEIVGSQQFRTVTAGGSHTCGITDAGEAKCWGSNDRGQLGTQSLATDICNGSECSLTPIVVSGELAFASVSAGGRHTCGVTIGGVAYCWGSNSAGQLGTAAALQTCGPHPCSRAPALVAGGLVFGQLSAGAGHTCGITTAGAVYCWGANSSGELGNGSRQDSAQPVAIVKAIPFFRVSAGTSYSCDVAADGGAYCWGRNDFGQLGTALTSGISSSPLRVSPPGS
jgi:alpha-tubulin suppressor-like RCC1 family protein